MADNLGSTPRDLGNRCTPMLVMGDSREAASLSSDCTPQLVLNTTSNVEPPEPEVTDNASGAGNFKLSESSVTDVRSEHRTVRLYTGKKTLKKRKVGSRRKWTNKDYEIAVECRFRVEAEGIHHQIGRNVHECWKEKNMFDIEENILMNQIRTIIKKGWLTDIELETIKRRVESELMNQNGNLEMEVIRTIDERDENGDQEAIRITEAEIPQENQQELQPAENEMDRTEEVPNEEQEY